MVSGGSGSEKREEREGLSEGVGFHRSCAWHSTWVDFFRLFFFLYFLYSSCETTGLLRLGWVNLALLFVLDIFDHFLAFFLIYCHFVQNLQNNTQSNKNLKIIIITSKKRL